jgi:hypothetical protein
MRFAARQFEHSTSARLDRAASTGKNEPLRRSMLSRTVELSRGSLDVLDEGENEKERFEQVQICRK